MIKLYTLKDLSDFSSDAVFKICLALEKYGLNQGQIKEFDSYDELYFETIVALEHGEHIIVAAENNDYNEFKRNIISRLILEEHSDEEIGAVIEKNAGEDISEIDITGHTLVARDSTVHLSRDGLYCGFTSDALLGKVTCVPLDFMRIDRIINLFKDDILPDENGGQKTIVMPEFDLFPAVSGFVANLKAGGSTMALATSEASMWVYNYYDKIEGFNNTLRFVEVTDSEQNDNATADSESVRIIRRAKEAMTSAGTTFGAAISEVYSTVNDKGQTVYFAYAALVDKNAAKAKKINTSNPDDLAAILPHTVTVLGDLVRDRLAAIKAQHNRPGLFDGIDDPEPEEKPKGFLSGVSPAIIAAAAAGITLAIVIPIVLVFFLLGSGDKDKEPSVNADITAYSDFTTTEADTTADPDEIIITPNLTEPSTQNIIMPEPTTNSVSSTSGTFTFDVFGYGHGAGLSQYGANYLAQQGWTWSEILAHYYYSPNGKILTGDLLPETISYNGTPYLTRDFLASVLEAEMGSSFMPEALKAQYVAIYTYAKYKRFNLDTADCAILGSGKIPSSAVYAVVDEMMGISPYIVDSNGECALTPFHAISAGKTTSFYNVWQQRNVDYLSGARLSYGDTLLGDKYRTSWSVSSEEFKRIVEGKKLPDGTTITLNGNPETWISVIAHDGALGDQVGYVSSMRIGGNVVTGNYFRINILEGRIRSHCFYVTYTPDQQ